MARMQGKTTSDIHQLFAGIDVSKAHLDLQLSCERRSRRFPNSPAGWAAIDAHLRARADTPCLIALEPTGRHHFPVWRALHAAGHGVAPLNPLHVRRFAESGGELTKTDALDAAVLARMAAERCPAAKAPPSEEQLRLKALTTSIADRTDRRATLKGQRAETRDPLIARFDEAEIARLSDAIDALKAERARLINANPQPPAWPGSCARFPASARPPPTGSPPTCRRSEPSMRNRRRRCSAPHPGPIRAENATNAATSKAAEDACAPRSTCPQSWPRTPTRTSRNSSSASSRRARTTLSSSPQSCENSSSSQTLSSLKTECGPQNALDRNT